MLTGDNDRDGALNGSGQVAGTAMSNRSGQHELPPLWCAFMELPPSSAYSQSSIGLLNSISGQTSQPLLAEFPRKIERDHQEPQKS